MTKPTTHPLRVWRESQGLTQTYVAEQLGLASSYLSMIEADMRLPSLETAALMSDFTGIPLVKFVRERA